MSRVQLALNVDDLEAAIEFYSTLFETPPHKTELGYANFEVEDPPLKLVLLEGVGEAGSLNHLGIEVLGAEDVRSADTRLREAGLETDPREATTCCYAVQDKTWVTDPAGRAWEVYTVLDDAPAATGAPVPVALGCDTSGACC